ncbi:MAG: FliH/SctL family protein [Planctomycetota bacterium]|jgi:flagellar biosynthesis/type III secretory pathway protein FliH
MAGTVTIELERPLESVEYTGDLNGSALTPESIDNSNDLIKSAGSVPQSQDLGQVFQALDAAASQLKHLQENIIKEHKEQIAKLADYKIEAIIQKALDNVPTLQNVVVHLNPEDFAQLQITETENDGEIFKDVRLVPDPNVGKAECLIETPKGVIESVIEEHLDNIVKALTNTE